jgi:hypothetical protein
MMDVDINLITASVDANATRQNQILDLGDNMSNNLYMTTEDFAHLVVDALDAHNYFKKGSLAHPEDISIAFATVSETIGVAMSWAISKDVEAKKKQAMMETTTLAKNYANNATYHRSTVLPMDEEIAPALLEEGESLVASSNGMGYSEWKKNR